MANKFSTAKNGYDKEEVDGYIAKAAAEFEEVSGRQKQRIFELKNHLTACENKLKAFNKMSGRIGEALAEAVSKAEQIEKYSMQKLQFEIEQLKSFHERWQEYYNRIMQRYPLDEDLEGVSRFNANMSRILGGGGAGDIKDAFDTHHKLETKRIAKKPPQPKPKKKAVAGSVTVKTYSEDDDYVQSLDRLLQKVIAVEVVDDETIDEIRTALARFERQIPPLAEGPARRKAGGKQGGPCALQVDPMQKISDYYKAEQAEINPVGTFNIREALNPKQSLEDILKELGVE